MYEKGKVDYVASNASPNTSRYQRTAREQPNTQLRSTFHLKREVLFFTERGRRELTREQRFDAALVMQEILHERHDPALTGGAIATQFLSPMTEGALSSDQLKAIDALRTKADYRRMTTKPKIAVAKDDLDFYKDLFGTHADRFEFQVIRDYADLVEGKIPADQEPHCYWTSTDVAWNESVTFLSYSLSKYRLGLSAEEGERWLETYIRETDRAQRVAMVNRLHFDMLSDPSVVPLYAEPYHSLLRNPWTEPRAPMLPAQGFWRIEWNG